MSHDPLFRSDPPGESAAPRPGEETRPRIGVWGRFDSSGFADRVQPWILEREIRRRLPEADLRTYAPLGGAETIASDAGFATVDLGQWSPRRATELSEALDCVVVAGDLFGVSDEWASTVAEPGAGGVRLAPFLVEGLGRELEEGCPVAWSAVGVAFDLEPEEGERLRAALPARPYVSVRDEASRERLQRAGVESEIALVPDPLLLLPRAFPPELLARRLEYLKHMEWFPRSGEPLVVQQSPAFVARAEELAAALATALERSPVPVVLLDLGTGRGDGTFADAVSRHLSVPIFRVPPDTAVSDLVAVLSHARAFVGTSVRASVACSAFGVPGLVVDRSFRTPSREAVLAIRRVLRAPRGTGAEPTDTSKLDAHFDRLAGLAESALAHRLRRGGDGEQGLLARLRENERVLESWRTAYAARTQQVVDSRLRSAALAEKAQAETRKLAAELNVLQEEAARRHHSWAAATSELAAERGERETGERELANERAQREAASRELAGERETSARALAEKEELARKADELRTRQAQVESELEESRARAAREKEELRQALEIAGNEASRREKRAAEEVLALRTDLDRARERLERARCDYSDLRASHTLLFTEIAETRADAGRSAKLVERLQAEVDRLQRLLSSIADPEHR
jgi:hypothetical protein